MSSSDTHIQDSQSTAAFWSAVVADKNEFRARVTCAAESRQGVRAYHESLSLLGIDANRGERPKLIAINGVRLAKR
jgi:hypothetical protein